MLFSHYTLGLTKGSDSYKVCSE